MFKGKDLMTEMVEKFNDFSVMFLRLLQDVVHANVAEDDKRLAVLEDEGPKKMADATQAYKQQNPEATDEDVQNYLAEAFENERNHYDSLLLHSEKKHKFLKWIGENMEDLDVAMSTPSSATIPIQDFYKKLESQPLNKDGKQRSPFDAILDLLIDETKLPEDLHELPFEDQQIELALAVQKGLAEGNVKTDVDDVKPLLTFAESVLDDFDFYALYRRFPKSLRKQVVLLMCQMTSLVKSWHEAGGDANLQAGLGRLVGALRGIK